MNRRRLVRYSIAYVVGVLATEYAAETLPSVVRTNALLFGVTTWQYLLLAILTVLAAIAYGLGQTLAISIASFRDRLADLPPLETLPLRRASGIVLASLTLRWFIDTAALAAHPAKIAALALDSALILGVMLLATAIWDAVCDRIAKRASNNERAERLLVPITRKMVRVLIIFAAVFLILGVYGINATGLIAGLGIGGIALALAAKDSVENVFGSLTILFDMPFALGDWVKIDKVEGVVEEINLRSTRIRTFEDTVIMLPNANLIRAGVENFGARRTRRQRISVRLSYDVDTARLSAYTDAIRSYLATCPHVPPDRSIVALEDFAEPSMGLLIQTYFFADTQAAELEFRDALLREVLRLREVHGVYFSSPVRPPLTYGSETIT